MIFFLLAVTRSVDNGIGLPRVRPVENFRFKIHIDVESILRQKRVGGFLVGCKAISSMGLESLAI